MILCCWGENKINIKPLNHSHDLPFLWPTDGAKQVIKKWIEELQIQPSSKTKKSNNQLAFNWALMKTSKEVRSLTTKGTHVIIDHNNYMSTCFEKQIKANY